MVALPDVVDSDNFNDCQLLTQKSESSYRYFVSLDYERNKDNLKETYDNLLTQNINNRLDGIETERSKNRVDCLKKYFLVICKLLGLQNLKISFLEEITNF